MPAATKWDLDYIFERSIPEPNSGCWIWLNAVNPDGYGIISKKPYTSHRLSCEIVNGPMPEGKEVHHKCENRSCCNPNHLEYLTHHENVLRSELIGTRNQNHAKTHCKRGHDLSGPNLRIERTGTKKGFARKCIACHNLNRLMRNTAKGTMK